MAILVKPCLLLVSARRLSTALPLLGTAAQKEVPVGQLTIRIPRAGSEMLNVVPVALFELDPAAAIHALTGLLNE